MTRRWVRPRAGGLGTVTVYFMTDEATANGIPDAATVTVVNDYIALRRPVTADVTVAAPTLVPLNVTIDMLDPDTPEVRFRGGGGARRPDSARRGAWGRDLANAHRRGDLLGGRGGLITSYSFRLRTWRTKRARSPCWGL